MAICAAVTSFKGRFFLAAGAMILLAGAVNYQFPGVLFAIDPCNSKRASAKDVGVLEAPANSPEEQICALAVSPDGKLLATGSFNGLVRLWHTEVLGKPFVQWRAHPEKINALTIAPDGRRLFTSGAEQMLRSWNLEGSEEPRLFGEWHTSGLITALAIAGDGTLAIAAGESLQLSSVNRNQLVSHCEWRVLGSPCRALAFAPDGRTLAGGGGGDNIIRVWSLRDGQVMPRMSLEGHAEHWVRGLAYSADGATLVSSDTEGCVLAWDVDGRLVGETRAGQAPCVFAALGAGGHMIMTKAICASSVRLSRLPDRWWR